MGWCQLRNYRIRLCYQQFFFCIDRRFAFAYRATLGSLTETDWLLKSRHKLTRMVYFRHASLASTYADTSGNRPTDSGSPLNYIELDICYVLQRPSTSTKRTRQEFELASFCLIIAFLALMTPILYTSVGSLRAESVHILASLRARLQNTLYLAGRIGGATLKLNAYMKSLIEFLLLILLHSWQL